MYLQSCVDGLPLYCRGKKDGFFPSSMHRHQFSPLPSAVTALQDLYRSLNNPPQLKGWQLNGGDPCEESWTGISCSGSSVIFIKLHGLHLGGTLGGRLFNLHNLTQLDVSSNNIQGEIPSLLPAKATHINLACNNFSQSIPYSLTSMKYLRHLNLSHNFFYGTIGNVFNGLQNLKEMDLSYNNFTGDLPSSFGSLTNLTGLFLQNNSFSGSVIFLANLQLSDLDIQNNHFSGVIPKHFQSIPRLWIGGNMFQIGGNYPSWDFPLDTIPNEQNISSPPTTQSSAIESYPSLRVGAHKQKMLGPGRIAFMVGGGTLVATCAAFAIAIHINRSRARMIRSFENNDSSLHSLPVSTIKDCSSATLEENPQILTAGSPPMIVPRHIPSVRNRRTEISRRRSFARNCRIPATAKQYTVAELQSATNRFSEDNLLGEGSLGSVYKAEFPDGQILAVKNINTVALSLHEEEQLLDVIWRVAHLRHPNIVTLLGYCIEHGQYLIVYEYVRNLSLDDALNCNAYKHLPWSLRVKIALGIARALDYLHSKCSPPVAHSNLKAANILLDDELMPRLCDCGLAILRPLTSNSVKIKASELAISCTGYIAPEHGRAGIDNTKSDIYAYGVLLLELLTGRKPFDSSRRREEQSLVIWASSRLHDKESLEEMVDPAIKKTLSCKALSRFADFISLCIQPEPEFRPSMSEIVESMFSLLKSSCMGQSSLGGVAESEASDKSFGSTHTCFVGSPTISYSSI
ncbi:hypothetical protein HHK36_032533 [Tetracentron sinense]|uniref:Protein kinase domain-containing protein n=1 Tax=Tetracentron sinense TaxID=13715 RepID=A0A834YAM8_TETSI|nr:hypothetical protein HHK36_032533 [Tetracentron sinense]